MYRSTESQSTFARNRGVALVSVLLMVGIVSALAYYLLQHHAISLRHAELTVEATRLHDYAMSVEDIAMQRLKRDWLDEESRRLDSHGERWAREPLQVRFDNTRAYLRITDLSSKFNVNALIGLEGELVQQAFERLCRTMGIDSQLPSRWRDWIDADRNSTVNGGEDEFYLLSDPGFRTANQLGTDLSELLVLVSMPPSLFAEMRSRFAVLPTVDLSLNVNTVSPEVLSSLLSPEADTSGLESLFASSRGFSNLDDAISRYPALAEIKPFLAVQSEFFEIKVTIIGASNRVDLESSVHRSFNTGHVSVIRRDLGHRHAWMEERGEILQLAAH